VTEYMELPSAPGPGGATGGSSGLGSHARRTRRPVTTTWLVVGGLTLVGAIPACSSSPSAPVSGSASSTAPSTPTSASIQQASSAEVAACEADAKLLEVALEAYMAQKGAFPSPPSPWSAATYDTNFDPLTAGGGGGGPYLPKPPSDKFYVIEYDSSGHVWIAPPGSYSATYDVGQSFDANPNICLAAVG
jgi:hypothetical protein